MNRLTQRVAPPRPKKISPTLTAPVYLNRHPGATFLVLGNGPSLVSHQKDICRLIEKHQPIVLGGNHITEFMYPAYHAFTNRRRFFTYGHTLNPTKSTVLLSPYFPQWIIESRYTGPYERLMYIDDSQRPFDIQNGIITSDCRSVVILLIGIALVMGAQQVFTVGMDGYQRLLKDANDLQFYGGDTDVGPDPDQKDSYFLQLEASQSGYLNQISEYMVRQGFEPFKILTPTVHSAHYQNIQELL